MVLLYSNSSRSTFTTNATSTELRWTPPQTQYSCSYSSLLSECIRYVHLYIPFVQSHSKFRYSILFSLPIMQSPFQSSPILIPTYVVHYHSIPVMSFQIFVFDLSPNLRLFFHSTCMSQVFDGLLRACEESKRSLIAWLVECFERNGDRAKVTRLKVLPVLFDTCSERSEQRLVVCMISK